MANNSVQSANQSAAITDDNRQITIYCGGDRYLLREADLREWSDFFGIVIPLYKQYFGQDAVAFPAEKRALVAAMVMYMGTGVYRGRVPSAQTTNTQPQRPEVARAGRTITFISADKALLKFFPDFEDGFGVSGDVAFRVGVLITAHEYFKKGNEPGYVGSGSEFVCRPEQLPKAIRHELLPFMWEVMNSKPEYTHDPVFHAQMYYFSIKYMLPRLKELAIAAIRDGCRPWIRMTDEAQHAFDKAVKILITGSDTSLREEMCPDMTDALIGVLAANWGWMRRYKAIECILETEGAMILLNKVRERFEAQKVQWDVCSE